MNGISAGRLSALAIAVAVLSLSINVYLALRIREAERVLAPARELMESLTIEDGSLRTDIRIPVGTPLNLDVPIDERVTIRIDTIIPIRTQVTVPLRSPVGNYDIPVPIRANVPLRANLPLRLRHTFRLRSETSEPIVVPIVVDGAGRVGVGNR
ncbi:MAG: hypothetical protein WD766_01720 [Gemmatimonadota bacterium]